MTHRCPLQCPYCSNPVELERNNAELTTDEWKRVMTELAEIGVLQFHFSGGEPTVRKDIVELVAHARAVGLYTNLITSAVLLTEGQGAGPRRRRARPRPDQLPGPELGVADRIAGFKDAHKKKLEAARWVKAAGCR